MIQLGYTRARVGCEAAINDFIFLRNMLCYQAYCHNVANNRSRNFIGSESLLQIVMKAVTAQFIVLFYIKNLDELGESNRFYNA